MLVQSLVSGGLGAVVGLTAGLPVTHALTGATPTPSFTTGLAVLAVLVTLLGSVPPAVAAARRDPVRELRVP